MDDFWDRLHWIPETVRHMPKEEEGQGLVHLAIRTFSLHFIQRLLIGPRTFVWWGTAYKLLHIVGVLGLDRMLFLMYARTIVFTELPDVYRGFFWIWNFKKQSNSSRKLEEPLVYRGHLHVFGLATLTLSRVLISLGILTLWHLVGFAWNCGPCMSLSSSYPIGSPH